jgi:hypothetical protein
VAAAETAAESPSSAARRLTAPVADRQSAVVELWRATDPLLAELRAGRRGPGRGTERGPAASVNYGAAGIAAALLGIAGARADAELLSLADAWCTRAEALSGRADAFANPELELTGETLGEAAPLHARSGVASVRAAVARALGDDAMHAAAVGEFIEASVKGHKGYDLTLGRAGTVLGAALCWTASRQPLRAIRCFSWAARTWPLSGAGLTAWAGLVRASTATWASPMAGPACSTPRSSGTARPETHCHPRWASGWSSSPGWPSRPPALAASPGPVASRLRRGRPPACPAGAMAPPDTWASGALLISSSAIPASSSTRSRQGGGCGMPRHGRQPVLRPDRPRLRPAAPPPHHPRMMPGCGARGAWPSAARISGSSRRSSAQPVQGTARPRSAGRRPGPAGASRSPVLRGGRWPPALLRAFADPRPPRSASLSRIPSHSLTG